MASGMIAKTVGGWGTPDNVTFPFTPTSDGMIFGYFAAQNAGNAYMYFREDGNDYYRSSTYSISAGLSFPVRKGHTYSIQLESNTGGKIIKFIPFE